MRYGVEQDHVSWDDDSEEDLSSLFSAEDLAELGGALAPKK